MSIVSARWLLSRLFPFLRLALIESYPPCSDATAIIPIATSPITITASTTATNNCTAARECSVTHTRVHANVPVNVRDRDDDEAKDKHDGGDK